MLWKHSVLVSVFIAFFMVIKRTTVASSVPNMCMMRQRRLVNTSSDVISKRQEDQIMNTIDTICGSYIDYVKCFTENLPNSNNIGDRFTNLMYQAKSMTLAYRGLCTLDLELLRDIKVCLMQTTEQRNCYSRYEEGVTKVLAMLDQGQFTLEGLQGLACNITVGRYKCETEIYGRCNMSAREIMQDFIFASLSDECRMRTEVTSRYLTAFKNEPIHKPNSYSSRCVSFSLWSVLLISIFALVICDL